ncbi:MAG: hypothetical protein HW386_2417 [Gammaproteobacteria bacterium]|nr:hypothetical protein [Gammaproteobacteria bacterium]
MRINALLGKHTLTLAVPVILLLPATNGSGRDIPYGAVDDPPLLACEASYWRGEQEASQCYRDLLQNATQPAIRAEAAWALGDMLYVDTYQYQEALALFDEALQLDPEYGFAQIGAASVLAKNFDPEALNYLEQATQNTAAPAGVRLRAMLLLGQMAMEESTLDKATKILQAAVDLSEQSGLPVLEAYAMRAALDLLSGNAHTEWIDKALALNPVYADAYAIPAYFFWITRRYRQAGEYYQKAVDLRNDHWEAQLELGINHLRFNRVAEARQHLELAYAGDPYNPKTTNTLRLLDTFEKFELLPYPARPRQNELPQLLLRMHRKETGVLMPYVTHLAETAIASYAGRYRFEPREPVIIEIYPNHEDFIVRTIGMPGMGLLGVTFGYLLAMDSPSGKANEDYHWGTTLWHELAHVFTLEITDHQVPRWFSEGISVYEEWRTGPVPGARIPYSVYKAINEGKLLPIADLDSGFIRPIYEDQVIVSYMQAGLICDFIDREFGFAKLVAMLQQFKLGRSTPDAVADVLQIAPAAFDKRFNGFIKERFGGVLENLDEWHSARTAAIKALHKEEWDSAIEHASQAQTLFPDYVESDSPYLTLATAYARIDNKEQQFASLETFWRKGGYTAEPLLTLAQLLYERGRATDAITILQAQNYVMPFNADLHNHLGDWLLESGQAGAALTEFEVALALAPHDLAAAHYRIARSHHALDHMPETRQHLLTALEIAPHYRPAQKLLLEITRK